MRIIQAWGMTETSPLGSVARPPRGQRGRRALGATARPPAGSMPLVEARLVDDDGERGAVGRRVDRRAGGARAVDRADYYEDPAGDEKFDDGWLRTGDIASIDARGYIRISDRAKDVIKSGGEWISSVDLENELMAHPTRSPRRR